MARFAGGIPGGVPKFWTRPAVLNIAAGPVVISGTLGVIDAPDWVPVDASIHIDFLGGMPQGRAWIRGIGEVAIETLLGHDPNANVASEYDSNDITVDGYFTDSIIAFIGTARTKLLEGATARIVFKQMTTATSGGGATILTVISANHSDAVVVDATVTDSRLSVYSFGGSASGDVPSALDWTAGAINIVACTVTGTRLEATANGIDTVAATTLDDADRPSGNLLVAAFYEYPSPTSVQSITIYNPFSSADELVALSTPSILFSSVDSAAFIGTVETAAAAAAGTAAGSGTATATGASTYAGIGNAPGLGTALATGAETAAAAGSSSGAGVASATGTVPDWVPHPAKIYIDFLGGSPQGRAWVRGIGEVSIDTLLGNDPVADGAGWSPTGYDPDDLSADGYRSSSGSTALLGAARSALLAGATVRFVQKQTQTTSAGSPLGLVSADAGAGLQIDASNLFGVLTGYSYSGSAFGEIVGVLNTTIGATNTVAYTVTDTRFEADANSYATPFEIVLDETDRPPENPFVAAVFDYRFAVVQSIAIYDPLPTAEDLIALSQPPAVSIAGTAAGTGAAAGAGAGTAASIASAAGTGTAAGITSAGATVAAAGSSSGAGVASATGAGTAAVAGTAAGIGAATATARATAAGVGTAAGTGAAAATAVAVAVATGTTAGIGAANAVGSSVAEAVGNAAGLATATGIPEGITVAVAVGAATGSGTATATASTIAAGVGAASGTGTADAIGSSEAVEPPIVIDGGVGGYYPPPHPFPVIGYGFGILPQLEGEAHGVVVVVGVGAGKLPRLGGEATGSAGVAGRSAAQLALVQAAAIGNSGQAGAATAVLKGLSVQSAGAIGIRGAGVAILEIKGAATGQHDDDEAAVMTFLLAA